MGNKKQLNLFLAGYTFAAVLLFIYVAYRSSFLSFTHDESLSYTIIEGSKQWLNTTNNHLLSTFLSKHSVGLFGISELSLRLSNLLSYLIFLAYGFLFFKNHVKNKWVILISFPFIFLNPLALDFFGLFRGYGLALSFLMASFFHFIRLVKHEKSIDHVLGMAFGALSIYSNYSFIVPVLSLWLAYFSIKTYSQWPKFPVKSSASLLLGSATLIPAALHISQLKSNNEIFFGGKGNAISDTLFPSLKLSFYNFNSELFLWALIILFFALIVFCLFNIQKKEVTFIGIALFSLTIAPSIAYHLFEINFAPGRAGTYWVLFFGLFIFFSVNHFYLNKNSHRIVFAIFTGLSFAFFINFIFSINISKTILWDFDANTKAALLKLNKEITPTTKKYTLGTFWLFEPSLNFYRKTKNYEWLSPVKRENELGEYDFYYLSENNLEMIKERCANELFQFKNTSTYMFESCEKDE